MKKIILTLIAVLGLAGSTHAQTWKMVVTKDDGTTDTLTTGKVKSVSSELGGRMKAVLLNGEAVIIS